MIDPASYRDELIRRLAYALDPCLDYLDRRARAEAREGVGKALRPVTEQQRAAMARKAVDEAFDMLGLPR